MEYILEKAYAKINLYLDVVCKRTDNYHDLVTIMQLVSLCDDVHIQLTQSKEINLTMENCPIDIPKEKNIAYLAAKMFYERLNIEPIGGADIRIVKRIPLAGGLSGGSADAAAVLRGLNNLYGKPFMLKELCAIGEEIGADVPFNIVGGAQSCTGIGANMLEIFGIRYYNILIACGEGKNSTAEQYALLDKRFNNFIDHKVGDNFHEMIAHLCSGECTAAFKKMYNVFECLYEENETFRKTKEIMLENEAKVAMLSGSGPTIFGVFPNSLFAEEAQEALAKEGIQSFLCHPINKTYEQILPNEEPWRD